MEGAVDDVSAGQTLKRGLAPVARADARILILGSLPGDASLGAAQYYAHPRNHFWTLVGHVTNRDLAGMEYPARIAALQSAGIALWDVVAAAHRPGSLDMHIANAALNDICALTRNMPDLRLVAFNGQKAAVLARPVLHDLPTETMTLPSSSPAHAVNIAVKEAVWAQLQPYLGTPALE